MPGPINQKGFAYLEVILGLIVLAIIGITGYSAWHAYGKSSGQNGLELSSLDPNGGSFADCVKSNGRIGDNASPDQKVSKAASEGVDLRADGLWCQATGSQTHTQDIWFATAQPDYDTRCHDSGACSAIEQAAQSICPAATEKPTFMYHPVIKGNYALLIWSDCSPAHYRITGSILGTVVLQKAGGQWKVVKILDAGHSCTTLSAAIPLEIRYSCMSPS